MGNRLQLDSSQDGVVTYQYDVANRLIEAGGVSYTWDNNGNPLSDGTSTYTDNHANRLASVTQDGVTYSYAYNGMGDRLVQTVDGVATNYTLALNAGLTQVLADGTNTYLYGRGRIAQVNSSTPQYFLGDALGSVRQVVGSAGVDVLNRSYQPYGEVLNQNGDGGTPYGFTGEWTDKAGLLYLRARYYDTNLGRFIRKDPSKLESNLYHYARGNPVMLTDPPGFCSAFDQECLEKARDLYERYGWRVLTIRSTEEIDVLLEAAMEIESWFKRHGGNGAARMRGNMAPVLINDAYFPFTGIFGIGGVHHVENNIAYLLRNPSKYIIVHEMGHILDNYIGGGNLMASITGGGPSDEMARYIGVDPTKCLFRFRCRAKYRSLIDKAQAERPMDHPDSYSYNGPSEDFAEVFKYSVLEQTKLSSGAPQRSNWMHRFGLSLTKTREEFNRFDVSGVFVGEKIPIPECDIPDTEKTPKPPIVSMQEGTPEP